MVFNKHHSVGSAAMALSLCRSALLRHGPRKLGHSCIARKNGPRVKSVTLYFFGGGSSPWKDIPRNHAGSCRWPLPSRRKRCAGIYLSLLGRAGYGFLRYRQCSDHHALDFRHQEYHTHGLQPPPSLPNGWGDASCRPGLPLAFLT